MSGEQTIAIGATIAAGAPTAVLRQQRGGSVQELATGAGATGNTQIQAETVYMGSGNALYASLSVQDGTGQVVYSLSPGQWYKIQITTQPAAVPGGRPIQAQQQISYRLRFVRADDLTVIEALHVPTLSLTAEQLNEARQARHSASCSFQVPTQAPALTLLLILYAWDADNGEQEVCRLPDLRLDGQDDGSAGGFSSDELKLLEAEELKLLDPAVAPGNVAYIYVQRPGEQLEILPFCKGHLPATRIALALDVAATYQYLNLDQAQTAPQADFVARIRNLSRSQLEDFWDWQQGFQQRGNTIYALFDLARSGLPWELLEDHESYLGCRALMVRWERFVDFTPRQLAIQDEERSGRVLVLRLNGQALPDGLQQLNPAYAANAVDLWEWLYDEPETFALVYISGARASDHTQLIDALQNRRLVTRRPIIMLAGAETTWTQTGQHSLHRLTDRLMSDVADGLITLAAPHFPEPALLTHVVGELVARIVQGSTPAAALQMLRAQYVQQYAELEAAGSAARTRARREDPANLPGVRAHYAQQLQAVYGPLLASFVYVYYGNPLLRLRLEQTP